jgi:hypothetical protein
MPEMAGSVVELKAWRLSRGIGAKPCPALRCATTKMEELGASLRGKMSSACRYDKKLDSPSGRHKQVIALPPLQAVLYSLWYFKSSTAY